MHLDGSQPVHEDLGHPGRQQDICMSPWLQELCILDWDRRIIIGYSTRIASSSRSWNDWFDSNLLMGFFASENSVYECDKMLT